MKVNFEKTLQRHFYSQFGITIDADLSELSVKEIINQNNHIIYKGTIYVIDNTGKTHGFFDYVMDNYMVFCPEDAEYTFTRDEHF